MMCTPFLSAVASSRLVGFAVGNSSQKILTAAVGLVVAFTLASRVPTPAAAVA